MKAAVVGLGHVGSAVASALVTDGAFTDLALVSRRRDWAEAEAMDLRHASCLGGMPMRIEAVGVDDLDGADLVVVAAGAPNVSLVRAEAAAANGAMYRELIPALARRCPQALLLVVSNPVEALTTHALELSGFPAERVIGAGTLIDSGRWRAGVAARLRIHPDDIRAYVLGEHGPAAVPAVSGMSIGGEPPGDPAFWADLARASAAEAQQIMRVRGYTNHAIARSVAMIAGAIARDLHCTLPVSVRPDGYIGVTDVCLSLPCVIGRRGVERILHPALDAGEREALLDCAGQVRRMLSECRRMQP